MKNWHFASFVLLLYTIQINLHEFPLKLTEIFS